MPKNNSKSVASVKAPRETKAAREARIAAESAAAAEAQRIAEENAMREAAKLEAETLRAAEVLRIAAEAAAANSAAPIKKVEHANGAAFTAQRPGVLAHIENLLRAATAEAPISKADILASLVVTFADRDEQKMKTTLNMQVPSGFRIEKGAIISKVEGRGFYFDTVKTEEYRKTHEKRGGAWRPKVVATTEAPAANSAAPTA